jgi:hypothetical protein
MATKANGRNVRKSRHIRQRQMGAKAFPSVSIIADCAWSAAARKFRRPYLVETLKFPDLRYCSARDTLNSLKLLPLPFATRLSSLSLSSSGFLCRLLDRTGQSQN